MKINRNYRFVLTCMPAEDYKRAEIYGTLQESRTGKFMFESECHYYVEKEILSCLKEAAKSDALDEYRDHVYLIWKETKRTTHKIKINGKEVVGTEIKSSTVKVDGKDITITEIECDETQIEEQLQATLIETIRLKGDDVEIR